MNDYYNDIEEALQMACEKSRKLPGVWAVLEWATDDSRSGDSPNEYEVASYVNREAAERAGSVAGLYVAGEAQE
ncbi:hypothetical protein [Ramlibacter sp. AN1133]|uniref:hypothetical protein n=1 Tax=Ramlibacter sp. AN1133 TaxID=3133429 RepID=UPI0030C5A6BB